MSETEEEFVTVTLPRRLGNKRLGKAMTGKWEGKDALLLLPEEVWRVILEELDDWRDLRNCSDTCTLFRGLSQTLPAFKRYALFGKALPQLYKYLNGAQILGCRAVCTAWSEGVDGFFENDKFLRPHSDMDGDPRRPQFVSLLREKGLGGLYSTTDSCRKWTQSMMKVNLAGDLAASHGRNPFIGREVVVCSDYPNLEASLTAYGKHIWYLTACIPRAGPAKDADSIRLLSMVTVEQDRFFPNLRRLRIASWEGFVWGQSCPIDWGSLPAAPHLETLQLNGLYNFKTPPPWVESLLRKYHLQLGRLDVRLNDHLRLVSQLEWPNLTDLRLEGHFTHYSGIRRYGLLLRTKMPKLRRLGLSPFPVEALRPELLELFRELPLSIRLAMSTFRIPGLAENLRRKSKSTGHSFTAPETLKTLEVGNYVAVSLTGVIDFTSYSFLRTFPFLENLSIFWRRDLANANMLADAGNILCQGKKGPKWKAALKATQDAEFFDDDDGLEVNKYLYRGEMYKSNIWEVLPRLKVLTFQMNCYTREGYHKFRMMEQD